MGGLHVSSSSRKELNARQVLAESLKRNVIFMPGDIFYTDGGGHNTFRLGISRVNRDQMEEGFKIIGEVINWAESQINIGAGAPPQCAPEERRYEKVSKFKNHPNWIMSVMTSGAGYGRSPKNGGGRPQDPQAGISGTPRRSG